MIYLRRASVAHLNIEQYVHNTLLSHRTRCQGLLTVLWIGKAKGSQDFVLVCHEFPLFIDAFIHVSMLNTIVMKWDGWVPFAISHCYFTANIKKNRTVAGVKWKENGNGRPWIASKFSVFDSVQLFSENGEKSVWNRRRLSVDWTIS